MFGLGFAEILFIAILAVIILGPEHMPKAARLIGQWIGKIRSTATSPNATISEDADLRELKQNLQSVRSEISSVKSDLLHPVTSLQETVTDTKTLLTPDATTAGRYSQPQAATASDSEKSVDVAHPSDFFNKPLNWFPEETNDPGVFKLARPKYLPEEISRKVSRTRIELPAPNAEKADKAASSVYLMDKPRPGRAFLQAIELSHPHPVSKSIRIIQLARKPKA